MMNAPPSSAPPSIPPPMPTPALDVEEIARETGYSVERIQADIARTGAQTKEDLYPQFYSGAGIQPQGETVAPGVVQGQPPAQPGAEAMPMPAQPGAAPPIAPAEAGGSMPVAPTAAGPQGIDPEVAQAMHTMMKPRRPPQRR